MSYSDYPSSPQSPGGMSARRLTNRNTNRYSVTALFSMAAEQDVEVEDELGRGMLPDITLACAIIDCLLFLFQSAKAAKGSQVPYICSVQAELCSRARRPLP